MQIGDRVKVINVEKRKSHEETYGVIVRDFGNEFVIAIEDEDEDEDAESDQN